MRTGLARHILGVAAMVATALGSTAVAATAVAGIAPGVAFAGGGASGSVAPRVAQRGDDIEFTMHCATTSSQASVTGTSLGLPSDIAMIKLSSRLFSLDVTVPVKASHGTHHIGMQCSDGSFTTVTLVVVPRGGANTGDGSTAGGMSSTGLAAGGGLIVAACAGGLLMRRRRTGAAR